MAKSHRNKPLPKDRPTKTCTWRGCRATPTWRFVHFLPTNEDRAKAVVDWAGSVFTHQRPGRITVNQEIEVLPDQVKRVPIELTPSTHTWPTSRVPRPIRTSDGEEFFALVMHPNAAYNLKQDTSYESWVKDARLRGESNPLFTGALAVIDGMILYQHSNVPVATGALVQYAKNIAFGAEAFVEGVDEVVSWDEDTFDYGNEFGIAYRFSMQSRRALEKNSLIVYSAAADVV